MFICKENYDYAETQHGTGTTGCLTNSFSLLSLLIKHDLRGRRVGFNPPSSNMLRVTLPYLQDQRESLMVLNQSQPFPFAGATLGWVCWIVCFQRGPLFPSKSRTHALQNQSLSCSGSLLTRGTRLRICKEGAVLPLEMIVAV